MVRLEFDRPVTRMVTQVARYEFETFSGELTVGVGIGRITIELNVLANLDGSADVCVIFQGLKACGGVSAPVGPQSCTSISLAGIAVPVCIPASAVYETVAVVNAQGIVEIAVGQNAELRFDGEVGQLIGRTYYLKDPKFSNRTAATIDPAMQIQLLCAGFTGLGEDKCLFDETFQTTGLTDIFVYNNNWVLGGFEDVEYNDVYRFDGPAKPDVTVAVPEPGTFSLMLLGFALLVLSTVQSRTRTRERKSA